MALYAVAWLLLPDRAGRIEARALLAGNTSGSGTAALVLFVLAAVVPGPGTWWSDGPLVSGSDLVGALVLTALAVVLVTWLPRWLDPTGRPAASTARTPAGEAPEEAGGASAAPRPTACRPSRRAPAGVSTGVAGLALLAGAATWLLLHARGVPGWQGELPTWLAGAEPRQALAVSAAVATAVFALGLVALGLAGRDDGAAGFLGTCTAVVAVAAAVVPAQARVDVFGDEPWRPTTVASAERGFAQLAGESVLDLRGLDAPPGATVEVPVRSGFGVVRVIPPEDAVVRVRGRMLAGDVADGGGEGPGGGGGVLADEVVAQRSPGAGSSEVLVDVQGLFGRVLLEGGAR